MIIFLTLIGKSKLYQHHQLNGSQTRVISELLMHKVQLWPQNISLPYSCWFWGFPVLLLTSIFSSPPQSMIRDLVMEGRTYTMHIKAVYRLDGWIYGVIWDITWTRACTRVCQFISVCASVMHVISVHPAGVHTHTHTVADTHIFLPLLVFSFVQTHWDTFSSSVWTLCSRPRGTVVSLWILVFSLWALWTHTLSDLSLRIFLCATLCVCVCV